MTVFYYSLFDSRVTVMQDHHKIYRYKIANHRLSKTYLYSNMLRNTFSILLIVIITIVKSQNIISNFNEIFPDIKGPLVHEIN